MPITDGRGADPLDDIIEAVEPVVRFESADSTLLLTRVTSRNDDRLTAALHHAELDGMFVRFGVGFLRSYHASFRRSPHAVAYVVVGPDGIVGFLVGTIDNEAHYQWLTRRALPALVIRATSALVRRPRVALDVLRTRRKRYLRALTRRLRARGSSTGRAVRRGRGSATLPDPVADPPPVDVRVDRRVGVLTHVAVVPGVRGRGIGRRLVAAYEDTLAGAGVGEARLITDPTGGAPAFYRRLGWSSVGVRAGADGAEVEEFVRTW